MGCCRTPCLRYLVPIFAAVLALGCGLTELLQGDGRQEPVASEEMTLAQALAVEPEDRRPTLLAEMGIPDAFTIHFEELEGQVVRWESWSYFDDLTTFDFLDGEFLWTVELAPISDGSLYAHFYSPTDFRAHMSVAEVRALLPEVAFTEVDLTDGGAPGGLALAGELILLGFDHDRLVYVETFILQPDGDAVPGESVAPATLKTAAEPAEMPTTTLTVGSHVPGLRSPDPRAIGEDWRGGRR